MISKKSALTSILLSSSVLLNGCEDDYHLNESTKECKKIAYEKNLILENFIHKKKNELDKKIDAKNQQNDEQRSLLIAAKEVAEYISKNPET
ncbi:hypothetical protein, partial [Candidatus Liberibacter solanacearum]|uniref:hypothetical protein n=1 Tax=Candidatus Liberibacter solanacearum TaxID=556287 RepID=UPI00387DCA20